MPLSPLSAARRQTSRSADQAQLQRVRWALVAMFGVFGIIATSWMGRLPSLRDALDISAGQLGGILVTGAIASLVGVSLVAQVTIKHGSRVTLWIGAVGAAVGFTAIGLSTFLGSVPLFIAGVMANGLTGPATMNPINLEAARVEKRLGKAILPHVHAAFSIGALVGSGISATTSLLDLHVGFHIIGVAVVVTAVRTLLIGPGTELQDIPQRELARAAAAASSDGITVDDADGRRVKRGASGGQALKAWTERRTILIGLVLLAASMSEGAAANWLNLAVVEGFGVREAVGAMAYGTFVVAMLTIRLLGAGLIDRFGRVTVLRVSGVSSLLGLLAFGLSPLLPLAWVGIALWGLGAAMAFPIGMAASADDPSKAAARVSVVGSFSSIASLSAPPVLGLLADAWGTRQALLVITAAMVVSLAAAGQVKPEKKPERTPETAPSAQPAPEAAPAVELSAEQLLQLRDDLEVAVEPVHAREPVGV